MRILFYLCLATGGLLFTTPTPGRATISPSPMLTGAPRKEDPREQTAQGQKTTTRKATRITYKAPKKTAIVPKSMLLALGLRKSMSVTAPAKRRRHLHIHQKHLRTRARHESRAHAHRCQQQMK